MRFLSLKESNKYTKRLDKINKRLLGKDLITIKLGIQFPPTFILNNYQGFDCPAVVKNRSWRLAKKLALKLRK